MSNHSKPPLIHIPNMIVYDCRGNEFRRLEYEMMWKCKICKRFLLTESVARAHKCYSGAYIDYTESDGDEMSSVDMNLYY